MQRTDAPRGAAASRSAEAPRWHTGLRLLLAIVGGYGWTALATAFLSRILPLDPLEAVTAATLASFAIYATLILTIIHARHLARAALIMALSAMAMAVPLWLQIASEGRL